MKGFGEKHKSKKKNNKKIKVSKEQIINQAFKFHSQGKISEATKYYQLFINQGGRDPRVFSNYGVILKSLGKLQEAELLYRKAIEIKSDFVDAHFNLGIILKDIGKLQEAELSTRKAIELKPDYAEAHSNLGNILNDLGKLKGAELSYRKAIKLNPNFANSYFNLFLHYEQINKLEKLKESLNEFNKIDSIKNELLLFSARLSFRNKEHKTAKELIDTISPEWIEKSNHYQKRIFWSYKAFIEDKVGNYDIAYTCFEKSQKNPTYQRFSKDPYLNYINSYKASIINRKIIFSLC